MIDDDILTIEEVAKYLRVSERTVYDWAQKAEIPAGKIGTVWRFKKSDIENWVNDRLSTNKPDNHSIQIGNILSPDRILFLDYSTKRDAILALADNLANAPQIKNRQELAAEILKREDLRYRPGNRYSPCPAVFGDGFGGFCRHQSYRYNRFPDFG